MKTRIISGAVLISLITLILALGYNQNRIVITLFIGFIAAAAVYEMLKNAFKVEKKLIYIISSVYAFLQVLFISGVFENTLLNMFSHERIKNKADLARRIFITNTLYNNGKMGLLAISIAVIYFIFAVCMILKNHGKFSLAQIAGISCMPFIIARGFSFLESIVVLSVGTVSNPGLYYLLLLLDFSAVCDTGAYFTGVVLGKRKLCPNISPHKTVEGAIGGIVSSVLVCVILVFAFKSNKILPTILLTIPLCIVGMLGDLFASSFKRAADIKDYGKIIPGHGGILDRFDSVLLLSPVVYILINYGII